MASQNLINSTFDALAQHIAILDETSEIIAVNRAWREFALNNCALVGDIKSMLNGNYLEICERAAQCGSNHAEAFGRGLRAVIKGESESFELEYPCHSPNERRWFIGRITRFSDGDRLRIVITHENITKLKLAEEALRKNEERFRLASKVISDAVWDWDITTDERWWSDGVWTIFGYEVGQINPSFETWFGNIHPEDRENIWASYNNDVESGKEFWSNEYRYRRADGSYTFVIDRAYIVRDADGKPIRAIGAMVDITERKSAEEQIKISLKEKEILLKEIHHRVKNNMQIVSSLLNIQAEYVKDPKALEMFEESRNRVRSMALIHEKLYKSKNLASIDFGEYVVNLANHIFRSYKVNPDIIKLKIETDNVLLGIDAAIPCGLIINEIISNSLKHAFPGDRKGEIVVSLKTQDGDNIRLVIRDDGIGLPPSSEIETSETLGLQLVFDLTDQIGGKISLCNQGGAVFEIDFSERKSREKSGRIFL